MELLFSESYALFTGALIILGVLLAIEVTAVLVAGTGAFSWMEATLDSEAFPQGVWLDWLLLREMPLSVGLMLLFGTFGCLGFVIQEGFTAYQGSAAAAPLAASVAFIVSLVLNKQIAKLLAPLFKTHSTAVSESSLVGRTGVLTSARVHRGYAGEFKVQDQHGQTHYVMVEPLEDDASFKEGDQLELVEQRGPVFMARAKTIL